MKRAGYYRKSLQLIQSIFSCVVGSFLLGLISVDTARDFQNMSGSIWARQTSCDFLNHFKPQYASCCELLECTRKYWTYPGQNSRTPPYLRRAGRSVIGLPLMLRPPAKRVGRGAYICAVARYMFYEQKQRTCTCGQVG